MAGLQKRSGPSAGEARASTPGRGGHVRGEAPVALYVHVPFCVSMCPYCDFVVVAGSASRGPRSLMPRFIDAVEHELALRAGALDERFGEPGSAGRSALSSLYLGGGTPSLLPTRALAELVGVVRARYGLRPGAEVTVEVNPGPDERGDLGAMRTLGVTRISIGAQSMDDGVLPSLGRRH